MSDDAATEKELLKKDELMKSIDDKIVFSNLVLGLGIHHGVVNITFGVMLFTPLAEANRVPPDPAINLRLRLDLPTARALYTELGARLQLIDSPEMAEFAAPDGAPRGAKPN